MRRRLPPKLPGKIKRKFFLRWRECEQCHEDIRFEYMWSLVSDLGIARGLNTLCHLCAPTRLVATHYFMKHHGPLAGLKMPKAPVSTTQVRV